MEVDILINELSKFSDSILDLNGPVEKKGIFEKKHQLILPEVIRNLLKGMTGLNSWV
jgi:hypothetical protein